MLLQGCDTWLDTHSNEYFTFDDDASLSSSSYAASATNNRDKIVNINSLLKNHNAFLVAVNISTLAKRYEQKHHYHRH